MVKYMNTTGQTIELVKVPPMSWDSDQVWTAIGGAALWGAVTKIVGTHKEKREENRNDEIHTFKQLKELVLFLDTSVKELQLKVSEQDKTIQTLSSSLHNEKLDSQTLRHDKEELQRTVKDLETRLGAAVAKGAGIAADLQRTLNWYQEELVRVMELYEQATGKKVAENPKPKPKE